MKVDIKKSSRDDKRYMAIFTYGIESLAYGHYKLE
jgi:hypothetical protein